jgi:ubiquinone/menaquinone biosynthesis C-methylase UbiE
MNTVAVHTNREERMSDRFYDAGASGYDKTCGFASQEFVPTLLRLARIGPGQEVLDVAAGTGNADEAISQLVGPSGSVMVTDLSVGMLDEARKRLAGLSNISFAVENGQALSFSDSRFDGVVCSMAMMMFPDYIKGLSEFYRVLKPGRHAAISVTANPERSFYAPIRTAIARHVRRGPSTQAYRYVLGDERYLSSVFANVGFRDVETTVETRKFPFESFGAFFDPIDQGVGHMGQEFIGLPADARRLVREDVRRALEKEPGSPIELPMEATFGCGRK